MNSVNRIENISDLLGEDLYQIGQKRHNKGYQIPKTAQNHIKKISEASAKAFKYSTKAIASFEVELAKNAKAIDKYEFQKLLNRAHKHQTKRLISEAGEDLNDYTVETDIIDKFQRIFYHSRKMTKDTLVLLEERSGKSKRVTIETEIVEELLAE